MVQGKAQNNLSDVDLAYVKENTTTLALELLGLGTGCYRYCLESSESNFIDALTEMRWASPRVYRVAETTVGTVSHLDLIVTTSPKRD